MSNDERVKKLEDKVKVELKYSETLTTKSKSAKPNTKKLKELASEIRKNLKDNPDIDTEDVERLEATTLKEVMKVVTTYINKEKARAELVGRIDELKRLPNTKPVWFDPKIHTNYIQDRLAQLEAQLTKDKEEI